MERPEMVRESSEMSVSEFIETFGHVFEHSPWIAENAWYRGLGARNDTVAGLHEALCNEIRRADHEQKLELLRAHPELGVAMGGRELSASSHREQLRSGLDACTPEEYAEFQRLNAAYREKFGFPFILAIKGYHRRQILEIFRQRLGHGQEEEFQAALAQVMKIGLFRLQELYE
jgi:OHCU decarboxylase